MNDLRERLHDALDEADFSSPDLMRGAISRLETPDQRTRLRWAPPVGAAAIALAVVVTLVALTLNRPVPSGASLPTSTTIDNLAGYQFVSPTTGWLSLESEDNHHDVVARTTDGGKSWHQVFDMPHGFPLTLQAINAQSAVLMGYDANDDGLVWKTDDGGVRWAKHVVPSPQPGFVEGVSGYFYGPAIGWLFFAIATCGGSMACASQSVLKQLVYQTTDGGKSWNQLGVNPQRSRQLRVDFVSSSVGVAVADTTVAVTHDGGRTWRATPFSGPTPACPALAACQFVATLSATMFDEQRGVVMLQTYDASRGYALASRSVYATLDGGLSWSYAPALPYKTDAALVQFLDFDADIAVSRESVSLQPGWYLDSMQVVGKDVWVLITTSAEEAAGLQPPQPPQFSMVHIIDYGPTWTRVALPKA